MEELTWTGSLGDILDPILFTLVPLFAALIVLRIAVSILLPAPTMQTNPDGTLSAVSGGPAVWVPKLSNWSGLALLALCLLEPNWTGKSANPRASMKN